MSPACPGRVGSGGPVGERGIFSRGPTETGVPLSVPELARLRGRGAGGRGQTHAPGSHRWVCGSQQARPFPGHSHGLPDKARSLSSESEARGRAGHSPRGWGAGGQGGAAPGGRAGGRAGTGRLGPTCPLRQRDSSPVGSSCDTSALIPGPWGLVGIDLSLSHGHRNWNKSEKGAMKQFLEELIASIINARGGIK